VGFAALVPAGTNHNFINTESVPLKLYTPPNHLDGVVHHTRVEAEKITNTSMAKHQKGV
jgi:mannose-6-phosphate isomerase-like protein (cupin superfamily)